MDRILSAFCIVDLRKEKQSLVLKETIWDPLEHFGIPYTVFDMAAGEEFPDSLASYGVIILAQENTASSLSSKNGDAIADSVKNGTGFVSLDSDIHHLPEPLKVAIGLWTSEEQTHMHVGFLDLPDGTTQAVRTVNNDHYITYTRELDFTRFNKPVPAGNIVGINNGARVLMVLANSSGCPALVVTGLGKGRVALFTISPRVWQREYFGHGGGLAEFSAHAFTWTRVPYWHPDDPKDHTSGRELSDEELKEVKALNIICTRYQHFKNQCILKYSLNIILNSFR